LDVQGRTIWIVDAHGCGKRFIVRADGKLAAISGTAKSDSRVRSLWPRRKMRSDEKLTAFMELQSAIHAFAVTFRSPA